MLIYPLTYTIHNGLTKVMVNKRGSSYSFYMHRSDNIRKIWSVDGNSNVANRAVNNNTRDADCLDAEMELLRLEEESNKNYN